MLFPHSLAVSLSLCCWICEVFAKLRLLPVHILYGFSFQAQAYLFATLFTTFYNMDIPLSLIQRTSHNSLPTCLLPKKMAHHISMPYSKAIEQFVKEYCHLTQNGIKRENYLCPICSINTAPI